MKRLTCTLIPLLAALWVNAAETDGELATIKEQELEAVRERISALKQSMDESAAARDRLTRDLQAAEIEISKQRIRLEELERERDFSARRKAELDAQVLSSPRLSPSIPAPHTCSPKPNKCHPSLVPTRHPTPPGVV